MKNQNKGITLIALVITIVVLVILVGVSVSTAINTGLIQNSKKAVEDYGKAQQAEEEQVKIAEDIMNSMDSKALAANVKVGDYVKYTPKSGEYYTSPKGDYEGSVDLQNGDTLLGGKMATINEKGEATGTGTPGNGYGEQTFTVPTDTNGIKWQVLSIENGKVNLVSDEVIKSNGLTGNGFTIKGLTGAVYGEEELQKICKIYGTGAGAEGARSITDAEINSHPTNGGLDWDFIFYEQYYYASPMTHLSNDYCSEKYWYGFTGPSDAAMLAYVDGTQETGWGYGIHPVVTLKSSVKAGTATTDANGVTTWDMVVPE